jgi:FAD/FMN-containing dehydrogenase
MMISLLHATEVAAPLYVEFLAELRLRGFEGNITSAASDRAVFATDNSIYQITPQAILFPRNSTDVIRVARLASEARFAKLVLTPRGGGAGTERTVSYRRDRRRTQAALIDGAHLLHPVQLLLNRLNGNRERAVAYSRIRKALMASTTRSTDCTALVG